jgi:hypothetical protein
MGVPPPPQWGVSSPAENCIELPDPPLTLIPGRFIRLPVRGRLAMRLHNQEHMSQAGVKATC